MSDGPNNYGVILYKAAIKELGEAVYPYIRSAKIGDLIFCQKVEHESNFTTLTIRPDQINCDIRTTMEIQIPSEFIKFIAFAEAQDHAAIGFV